MFSVTVKDFGDWREKARELVQRAVPPASVGWNRTQEQHALFGETPLPEARAQAPSVSKAFLAFAFTVSCHRSPERWDMLYQALWRMARGERHLLALATDPLVRRLLQMEKQVRRDAHKAKAFVRFRQTIENNVEHFIAWHEPDHFILPIVAGFFERRFAVQHWTILTPDASLHWDGATLHHGPGADKSLAPESDRLEDLWRDYYRATFNPARIKLSMMKSEMPVRYWHNLPETEILSEMLEEAPARVALMLAHQEGSAVSAADFLPMAANSPAELAQAAAACKGCPLYQPATQTVFGKGPAHARLMLVGEQPGDEEDRLGQPFVGPAGKLLDALLQEAGIDRAQLYITNAVKHFGFRPENGKRLHATPKAAHVTACLPWLEAEIAMVNPTVILALGATAGRALLGAGFTLKLDRALWRRRGAAAVTASYHPSAILRAQGQEKERYRIMLAQDMRMAAARAGILS